MYSATTVDTTEGMLPLSTLQRLGLRVQPLEGLVPGASVLRWEGLVMPETVCGCSSDEPEWLLESVGAAVLVPTLWTVEDVEASPIPLYRLFPVELGVEWYYTLSSAYAPCWDLTPVERDQGKRLVEASLKESMLTQESLRLQETLSVACHEGLTSEDVAGLLGKDEDEINKIMEEHDDLYWDLTEQAYGALRDRAWSSWQPPAYQTRMLCKTSRISRNAWKTLNDIHPDSLLEQELAPWHYYARSQE